MTNQRSDELRRAAREAPATYYEALTGEPDPRREFFLSARRALNLLIWTLAIGFPLVLVLGAVIGGEPFGNVVLIGVFGLGIGMMIRSTFARTLRFF